MAPAGYAFLGVMMTVWLGKGTLSVGLKPKPLNAILQRVITARPLSARSQHKLSVCLAPLSVTRLWNEKVKGKKGLASATEKKKFSFNYFGLFNFFIFMDASGELETSLFRKGQTLHWLLLLLSPHLFLRCS